MSTYFKQTYQATLKGNLSLQDDTCQDTNKQIRLKDVNTGLKPKHCGVELYMQYIEAAIGRSELKMLREVYEDCSSQNLQQLCIATKSASSFHFSKFNALYTRSVEKK